MAFRCDDSPLAEMQRLEALRQRDPQSAANTVANGKLLVEWARDGRLRELQCALDHIGVDRVLLFYSVRMFRVACRERRLDVLRFMLANGFDLQQACMRDVLHGVVEAVADPDGAEAAQPLVRLLLDAGVDVNWQRQSDLCTALHVVCRKNLYALAYLLILYDADVNAIASITIPTQNDEMPLQSAERMAFLGRAATANDAEENAKLLALLSDCGARRSWRRNAGASSETNGLRAPQLQLEDAPPLSESSTARPPCILSFSAATTLGSFGTAERPFSGNEELLQAFSQGIQLDTPSPDWSFEIAVIFPPDRQKKTEAPRPQSYPHSPAAMADRSRASHPLLHNHAQSATELPLSITALVLLLRDAEHLTARYGSTSAACARLDELERAHVDLQAQLASLQQKLNSAMAAAAAAKADQTAHAANSMHRTPPPPIFDADALLGFLQHHCACRGNLSLLQPVLGDFQRSFTLPLDTRFPSRDVLLTVHEISNPNVEPPPPSPLLSQPRQLQPQQQVHQPFLHANDGGGSYAPPLLGHTPMTNELARMKKAHEMSRLTPKSKALGGGRGGDASATSSPVRPNGALLASPPRLLAPATRPSGANGPQQVDRRAQQDETQTASAAIMLSALSRPTSTSMVRSSNSSAATTTATTTSSAAEPAMMTALARSTPSSTTSRRSPEDAAAQQKKRAAQRASATDKAAGGDESDGSMNTRMRAAAASASVSTATSTDATAAASATIAPHEVVVKQNLYMPYDKRNVAELKQSSMLLTLEGLDEVVRLAPWDDVYKLRTTFSHVLDYTTLNEPARRWFIGALRVQFVWRREFWERLHWLPMSEAVCTGPPWEKYRQTRKRRANKAIAAWRKVYSSSLDLMRQRLLPDDVWCDVSLWYMPSTPLYWLPNSVDLVEELALVDAKHPVRCYFVKDFRKHPFYNDVNIQRKYPSKFDLPPPQLLALQNEEKESRVNITPE